MDNLSRLHNRQLRRVRNASRYLRNSTVRKDLKTITLSKRISDLAKKFYSKIFDRPNEIVAELPDYNAFEPHHRKRPRFSIIMDTQ